MQISGLRCHFAGSAARTAPQDLIEYGHKLIRELVAALAKEGATFAVGVGAEPHVSDEFASPAIIFDWTVMESLLEAYLNGSIRGGDLIGKSLATVATAKTDKQIPEDRRHIWESLIAAGVVDLQHTTDGWYFGALRRSMLADVSDIVILLSGGAGVEHLAEEYALKNKPVIPLDLDIGASSSDGSGGAVKLYRTMLHEPEQFARFQDPTSAGSLLAQISTRRGQTDTARVSESVIQLITALKPKKAFYVRALNSNMEDYAMLEKFFSQVVDPVVRHLGYEPFVMGTNENNDAWMNQQIFDNLHQSELTIADLTGLRPNCFMELGFALADVPHVLVTAKKGTHLPFDSQALDCHFWEDSTDLESRIAEFEDYWRRNYNRPGLISRR